MRNIHQRSPQCLLLLILTFFLSLFYILLLFLLVDVRSRYSISTLIPVAGGIEVYLFVISRRCCILSLQCVITLHLSISFFQRTSENCLLFPFHLCVFVFGSWGMPVKSPQFCLCIILKLFSEWEEKGRGVTLSKGPQVTSGLNLSWSLGFSLSFFVL